ncbi:MAG: hypothetical protein WC805_00645 [Patescibacteria group bacterium]|jgi:hypothetical protein
MAIKNIFHYTYYFDASINSEFPGFWAMVIILALILVLSIILQTRHNKLFKKLNKEKKFWWAHWLNMGYTLSITGLIWLFFRYQGIAYFNWRFWPALLILGILIWLAYLAYQRRLLPKQRLEQEAEKSQAYYFRRRRKK